MRSLPTVSPAKRLVWSSLCGVIRTYQRLFMRLHVWGREHIPAGPKIFVTNHISTHDSFWVMPLFGCPLHIVIGPGYQQRMVAPLLDWLEQINALPEHRSTVVTEAVAYLQRGESVYIAPEGDAQELFRLGRFYPGVARIYRGSAAPIVPVALAAPKRAMWETPVREVVAGRVYQTRTVLRGPFCINIGEPLRPEVPEGPAAEQDEFVLRALRASLQGLLDDMRVNKFWLDR